MTQEIAPQNSFISAVFYGDEQTVKQLLTEHKGEIDVNCDLFDYTPLIFSSYQENTDIVRMLLDSGAKPDLEDKEGSTALRWAARNGSEKALSLLLEAGADPNLADKEDKMTALHYAVFARSDEAVATLLKAGADPTLENIHGETAMHYAYKLGLKDIVIQFQNYAAEKKLKVQEEQQSLSAAMRKAQMERQANLRRYCRPAPPKNNHPQP
ncbi:MAG: ankyrin repeat domain-containing protein [Alphaproteobacteria bacterium]|nr:MAG: ankyrin repeat domain-containing protein [Alphaproteobacteria bacterium]